MQNYGFCHVTTAAMTCKYTKTTNGFIRKSLSGGHLRHPFQALRKWLAAIIVELIYKYVCVVHSAVI